MFWPFAVLAFFFKMSCAADLAELCLSICQRSFWCQTLRSHSLTFRRCTFQLFTSKSSSDRRSSKACAMTFCSPICTAVKSSTDEVSVDDLSLRSLRMAAMPWKNWTNWPTPTSNPNPFWPKPSPHWNNKNQTSKNCNDFYVTGVVSGTELFVHGHQCWLKFHVHDWFTLCQLCQEPLWLGIRQVSRLRDRLGKREGNGGKINLKNWFKGFNQRAGFQAPSPCLELAKSLLGPEHLTVWHPPTESKQCGIIVVGCT